MNKGKYCCFFCPVSDYSEKSLDDACPNCGRNYGFVLDSPPINIDNYKIIKSLGRGFYAATFIAERLPLNVPCVIKLSPTSFYEFEDFHRTDFISECNRHAKAARGAQHIIGIQNYLTDKVIFSDHSKSVLECNICELQFVDGPLLRDYLDGKEDASATTLIQITIDLLRIRSEFENKGLNHNDLHSENLIVEKILPEMRRTDAIDPLIRVMAIDLGSIDDKSKSDEVKQRRGDLLWVATHIEGLINHKIRKSSDLTDRDYRIILALQSVINTLLNPPERSRNPDSEDLIEQIRTVYNRATQPWRPWREQFKLQNFGAHYNAQTLESWNVPYLMVDPDGKWMEQVSQPGPQIVTGIRGCGKTMLLRALEFHARAAQIHPDESAEYIVERLRNDKYVGLFVSVQRLLDLKVQSIFSTERQLLRLLLYFGLQAIRAIQHLKDIDQSQVSHNSHKLMAHAIGDHINNVDYIFDAVSLEDLETKIERMVVQTTRDSKDYLIEGVGPTEIFQHFSESLRRCASIWNSATIFFLLDDVSTRYLEIDKIGNLISVLMFSNPVCAFKMTSEWQTIELGLKSPGRINPVRIDRDVSIFDLGEQVHRTLKEGNAYSARKFVGQILKQRAAVYPGHPDNDPKELLGDVTLETIASEICETKETDRKRKSIYRGISCISHACVGDIGDIILLYREILMRWQRNNSPLLPIPDVIQSESFLHLCSRRLYDLNRRAGILKDTAITFAEAAYELLKQSHKKTLKDEKQRLRQYYSVYIKITAEDRSVIKKQIDRLRELIDAGVFIFTGGAARTKTRDTDPLLQFKLSYRKIYGLTNFIGLSDRDRFELSDDLEEWLEHPENGKEILMRNLGGSENDVIDTYSTDNKNETTDEERFPIKRGKSIQTTYPIFTNKIEREEALMPEPLSIKIDNLELEQLKLLGIKAVVVGLGFESRTLESNSLLANNLNPEQVYAVRYQNPGFAREIEKEWNKKNHALNILEYEKLFTGSPDYGASTLIDITGLAKPYIYNTIRIQLIKHNQVYIFHVGAQMHYPTHDDLKNLLEAEKGDDPYRIMERLSEVLKGEEGPYEAINLLPSGSDESRKRSLIAFTSPKHKRIFSLLENREYDQIEVVCPSSDKPRSKVAKMAGNIISWDYPHTNLSYSDTDDLVTLIRHCDDLYLKQYAVGGANCEIGLTGSKIQAVAAAVLSSRRKISQAWYLRPKTFDSKRFSKGVGKARCYKIELKQ